MTPRGRRIDSAAQEDVRFFDERVGSLAEAERTLVAAALVSGASARYVNDHGDDDDGCLRWVPRQIGGPRRNNQLRRCGGEASRVLSYQHVCPVSRDPVLASLEVTPTAIALYGHRMILEAEVCIGGFVGLRRLVESQGPSAPPWKNQKHSI